MRLCALILLAACARTGDDVSPDPDLDPDASADDADDEGEDEDDTDQDSEDGEDDDPDQDDEDDEDDQDDEDDEDEDPSEYTYDDDEIEPLLSADEVTDAISDGIARTFAIDPFLVLETFDATWADGDSDCPSQNSDYYELYGYHYLYGGCTSDTDVYYDGTIYGVHRGEYWSSSTYHYRDMGYWSGDWAVEYEDGTRYDQSGYFYMYEYEYTPSEWVSTYVRFLGEVAHTGEDFEDTWLGDPLSTEFTIHSLGYPGYGNYINLDGGISGLTGDATTIHFDTVYMGTNNYTSCEAEPSGVISIRDSDGEWYQVLFDGPAYSGAESFPPDCDGCGELWFRGEQLGEICPDFRTLTDWEETPW